MQQIDKKKVFILGDQTTDLILVKDARVSNVVNKNTQKLIQFYEKKSGVYTLSMLFNRLNDKQKNFEVLDKYVVPCEYKTVSEWNKKLFEDNKEKETRLFLSEYVGGYLSDGEDTNNKEVTQELNIDGLTKVIVVYNMNNKNKYCTESFIEKMEQMGTMYNNTRERKTELNYKLKELKNRGTMDKNAQERKAALTDELQKLNRETLILLRTKFNKNKTPTSFFKLISSNETVINKTILLFNVDELRRGDFNIQKGVSWEQLAKETIHALSNALKPASLNFLLRKFKAIVICFNQEGCLVLLGETRKLFYYPKEIEGDFLRQGKHVFGSIVTMQASIAWALANNDNENIKQSLYSGVRSGLVAMRHLVTSGFKENADFPYDEVVSKINARHDKTEKPNVYPVEWLIKGNIDDFSIVSNLTENQEFKICKEIVKTGETKKYNVPYVRYNDLITYDKSEIEQLRDTEHLLHTYIEDISMTKPLSFCVLGAPGSGKSFAVEQIVESIKTAKETEVFNFNLSQMNDSGELATAFHQIRNAGLKDKLPIVFFDEFDSKIGETKLFWLKYFLAPMNDGVFTEKVFSYSVGRAIFIFAGGLYHSMLEFKTDVAENLDNSCKAQDFISRLDGYIDIFGPNERLCHKSSKNFFTQSKEHMCGLQDSQAPFKDSKSCSDFAKMHKKAIKNEEAFEPKGLQNTAQNTFQKNIHYIKDCKFKHEFCLNFSSNFRLRRATLLRSVLEKKLDKKDTDTINIDDNVLKAFLYIDEYLNGSRSLKAIVKKINIVQDDHIAASDINTNSLEMYVNDDKKFIRLLNEGRREDK